jgi:glycosyltransferase involved in cell wall biosynthesis
MGSSGSGSGLPANVIAQKLRSIHCIPGLSEASSGPSYSVARLCEALIDVGHEVTLAALRLGVGREHPAFVKTFALGWGPTRLGNSPDLKRWLIEQVRLQRVDVLHSHGMWQLNSMYPGWASKHGRVKLVISPRGALSRYAMSHGSRLKKIVWPLLQHPALSAADCFHATALSEYQDIRRLGFKQPVAVIPNGIDTPADVSRVEKEGRTLLFVGRIHPIKGLPSLLHAWKEVSHEFPQWDLSIVGSDAGYYGSTGYLNELRELAADLKLDRVQFMGEVLGDEKWRVYRSAELFVLPTNSENFGLAVAEALSIGLPAIVTKGAPWSPLAEKSAGWWIEIGREPLVRCLRHALSQSREELLAMGAAGREWMKAEYSWEHVGAMMADTYTWLSSDRNQPPQCLRFD